MLNLDLSLWFYKYVKHIHYLVPRVDSTEYLPKYFVFLIFMALIYFWLFCRTPKIAKIKQAKKRSKKTISIIYTYMYRISHLLADNYTPLTI